MGGYRKKGGQLDKDKWCSYCKCLHERTDFSPKPSEYDGLAGVCKKSSSDRWVALGYNSKWGVKLYKQYWHLKNKKNCDSISWIV